MFRIYADNDKLLYQPGDEENYLISPKLTLEIGKSGSLDFGITSRHSLYDSLNQLTTILSVEDDNEEIFRGRVLTNIKTFNGIRQINGEGNLSYLVDSVINPQKYEGFTSKNTGTRYYLHSKIIPQHNAMVDDYKKFEVDINYVSKSLARDLFISGKSDDTKYKEAETTKFNYKQIAINMNSGEWQTTYDHIDTHLLEYCGGYLRTRYNKNTNVTYLDWLDEDDYAKSTPGASATKPYAINQTIEVGKNLLDLTEDVSSEDVFTVLIPLGDPPDINSSENLSIKACDAFNDTTAKIQHKAGSIELLDTAGIAKYGRIVKTHVFDNVNTKETLLENAKRFLKNNENMRRTITVTAVDLHFTNNDLSPIYIGNRVHIISAFHDIDDVFMCTKIEYDLANPANTVYTFGQPKQTLTQRYRKDKEKQAASSAGGGGGGGAGGAAEAATEDADKNVKEIFDAWIKYNPDDATLDLGALYEKLTGEKLKNQVGIKIDGKAGVMDLYADHNSIITNGNNIEEIVSKTGIKLNAEQSTVDIFAHYDKWSKDRERLINEAGIKLDGKNALINIAAMHSTWEKDRQKLKNKVGIDLDATKGLINIQSVASNVETNEEHIASIELWAGVDENGKIGSKIVAKADLISLIADNLKLQASELMSLISKKLTISAGDGYISIPSIHTTNLTVSGTINYKNEAGDNKEYDVYDHTHSFTEKDGNIYIGKADRTGTPHFFKIAATKKYIDDVAAAKAGVAYTSFTLDYANVYGDLGKAFIYGNINLSNGRSFYVAIHN